MSRRYATSGGDINTLAAYLREIAKLPRLTPDEERELASRIQQGRDQAALSKLVESNLRFVVSYTKRYRGLGVSWSRNKVWGFESYPITRTVDNHVSSLRAKLEADPARPVHIQTVHGVGYKFVPDKGQ